MTKASPPVAPVRPHSHTHHATTLSDPYAWLRDPAYPKVEDPDILAYLNAENSYFDAHMADHAGLIDTLFAELKGRMAEDDRSVPWPDGDWFYWWAFEAGSQYRRWYRRAKAGGPDRLLLSEPDAAAGHAYFRLGTFKVSPDGEKLAWSHDSDGSERFTLVIRDLATGQDIETVSDQCLGEVAWTADSRALVWTRASAEWRPDKAFLHRLGTPPEADLLLYAEPDATYWLSVSTTQDRRWIILSSSESDTTEQRLLDAQDPDAPARIVRAREAGVRYEVDASGDTLFVLTNDSHVNFRIATSTLADPARWTSLIPGSDRVYLTGITAFASYLAIEERLLGLDQIRLRFPDGRERRIAFPEASYTASLGTNAEADAPMLRLTYSSMITPETVFDHDVAADSLIARKVQTIPSGYDPTRYATERLLARARDGTAVPVSVVYRKGYRKDGSQPLHVYGYGAYGIAIPPGFSASRLSLLDRGFAYAIAHVRGGDDLGYQWYLDGKLEKRGATFDDFIDATRFLNAQGFGRSGHNSASGGSAGGWLMGAVVNQAPELWRAIVAHVPFVDVLNTMLDETLPLTPGEWSQWGNPRTDPSAFERLRALSPYDQTMPRAYPAMLITGGISDPRVTYWEPAKWAARIRAVKTDDNLLLLKINMGAGHGGKSGRFERLRETAEEYAFLLAAFAGKANSG